MTTDLYFLRRHDLSIIFEHFCVCVYSPITSQPFSLFTSQQIFFYRIIVQLNVFYSLLKEHSRVFYRFFW